MPTYTDDLLDRMRERTDPLADDAVRVVFEEGKVDAVNRLLANLVENEDPVPSELPEAVRRYFERTEGRPAWADRARTARGEHLFGRYGMKMVMILHCYSLPSCYAVAKAVKVLDRTARLSKNPHRRIVETAQMIIDVMAPGGLERDGRGVRSAQKVRLMHAAIRHLIDARGNWSADWGRPINQEDLAGTLCTFSVVILDGLRKLGVRLTGDEAEAYLHAWKVVGHILGIEHELIPANVAEAEALWRAVQRRHFARSEEGQRMTRALLELLEHMTPGNVFDGFPASFVRYFMGDAHADLLGVPSADWTEAMLKPLRLLGEAVDALGDRNAALARASEHYSRAMIEGLLLVERGGKRVRFRIPSELRERWGMDGAATGEANRDGPPEWLVELWRWVGRLRKAVR